MKTETVEEFLQRGGEIHHIPNEESLDEILSKSQRMWKVKDNAKYMKDETGRLPTAEEQFGLMK